MAKSRRLAVSATKPIEPSMQTITSLHQALSTVTPTWTLKYFGIRLVLVLAITVSPAWSWEIAALRLPLVQNVTPALYSKISSALRTFLRAQCRLESNGHGRRSPSSSTLLTNSQRVLITPATLDIQRYGRTSWVSVRLLNARRRTNLVGCAILPRRVFVPERSVSRHRERPIM